MVKFLSLVFAPCVRYFLTHFDLNSRWWLRQKITVQYCNLKITYIHTHESTKLTEQKWSSPQSHTHTFGHVSWSNIDPINLRSIIIWHKHNLGQLVWPSTLGHTYGIFPDMTAPLKYPHLPYFLHHFMAEGYPNLQVIFPIPFSSHFIHSSTISPYPFITVMLASTFSKITNAKNYHK